MQNHTDTHKYRPTELQTYTGLEQKGSNHMICQRHTLIHTHTQTHARTGNEQNEHLKAHKILPWQNQLNLCIK